MIRRGGAQDFHAAGLAARVANVLSNGAGSSQSLGLSQSSYRAAVAAIVNAIKLGQGLSDADMADDLFVSATTINNASNRRGNLDPVTLLRIGATYGLPALDPVLLLIGAKPVPLDAASASASASPGEMAVGAARGQLFLARALADQVIYDGELLDGAAEIEAAYATFAELKHRLDRLRTAREG